MPDPPDLPRRLSSLDAGFLYLERPSQVLHIALALTFEGVLDYERLIADLRARLPEVPRYFDRIMPTPLGLAHPTWEPDPEFDLRAHVHRRTLRPRGTERDLAELCAGLYAQPLARTKPLWEIYLIDGYRGGTRPADTPASPREPDGPPRSVLFAKVHHCMLDGVSGIELLGALLDPSPTPRPVEGPRFRPRPPLPGATSRLVTAISDRMAAGVREVMQALTLLAHPRRARREAQETASAVAHAMRTLVSGAPKSPLNGRLGIPRTLGWATFPLNDIKAIKNHLGGSVNDVVLAVISGAMRRILADRGMNPDRVELRAAVPVNVRRTHEHLKLGNQISLMVAPLPIGILDPVERLRQVRTAMEILKGLDESAKLKRILQFLDLLPASVEQLLGWARGVASPVNTICTNVPGPPVSLYMQGVRLKRMMPFVPLAEPVGLAFAILSYADTLTISLTADAGLVPDMGEVVEPLYASFEELWTASGLARITKLGPVPPERQRRLKSPGGGAPAEPSPDVAASH